MTLKMKEVPEVEYNLFNDWVQRIHRATICCNNERIKDVVHEIQMFNWIGEGETYEGKLLDLQNKR